MRKSIIMALIISIVIMLTGCSYALEMNTNSVLNAISNTAETPIGINEANNQNPFWAQDLEELDDKFILDEPEEYDEDWYDYVEFEEMEHEGDYFEATGLSKISKTTVHGNMFIFAESVNLNEVYVEGNIFIAAQNISLDGVVAYNAFIAGETIHIKNADIEDVYAAGETIKINATIERSLKAAAENITLQGEYGTCYIGAENIKIKEAEIENLAYSSENRASIDEESEIMSTNFNQVMPRQKEMKKDFNGTSLLVSLFAFIVNIAIISSICIFTTKKYVKVAASSSTAEIIFKSLGFGLLGIAALPIAMIALAISGVGFRLSLALMFLYVICFMFANPVAVCLIVYNLYGNRYDLSDSKSRYNLLGLTVAAGAIMFVIEKLPVIGGFAKSVMVIIGFGSIIRSVIFNIQKAEKKHQEELKREKEVELIKEAHTEVKEAAKKLDEIEKNGQTKTTTANKTAANKTVANKTTNAKPKTNKSTNSKPKSKKANNDKSNKAEK